MTDEDRDEARTSASSELPLADRCRAEDMRLGRCVLADGHGGAHGTNFAPFFFGRGSEEAEAVLAKIHAMHGRTRSP